MQSAEAILADTRWGHEPGVLVTGSELVARGSDAAASAAVSKVQSLMGQPGHAALSSSDLSGFQLPEQAYPVSHLRTCIDLSGSYAVRGGGAPARSEDGISESVLPRLLDAERATEELHAALDKAMREHGGGGSDADLLSMHHQDANSLLVAALQELQMPAARHIEQTRFQGRSVRTSTSGAYRGFEARVDGMPRTYELQLQDGCIVC